MPQFVSLKPSGLSEAFDAEVHTEQPVVTLEETADTIVVSYVFPGFVLSDDDRETDEVLMPFREVGISGAGFLSDSGKPLLPSFGRFVQIPMGCNFDIKVNRSRRVNFEDILITPAQEEALDGPEDAFEFDEEFYQRDEFYPSDIGEVSEPQSMDAYRVLLLHVRPLLYNAAKKLLIGYSNITVTIKLTSADPTDNDEVDDIFNDNPESNLEAFGNLTLNPRRRINERISEIRPAARTRIQIVRGPEFLVIHDENLKNPAVKLADWKNKRGLITETISIKSIGNSVAKIKKAIRDRRRYLGSRLRYVLLFGDVQSITSEQLGGATTDHYYYTSKDPSTPSDCLLPWVSGGRIPVTSVREAETIVDQIIRYEKTPACDPAYYRRMTFAAFFQDNYPQNGKADRAYMRTMEGIREHMLTIGFDVERVYVSNNPTPLTYKDGTAVSAEVKGSIVDGATATDMMISSASEGQLAIGHRDHGDTDGWSHPAFQLEHLAAVLSQYTSIFYSINCLTGQFDANPIDSFAEALLKLNGGAPSLIAATELSGTWRNDSMMKGLFDAIWPGIIPTFPSTTASYPVKYNRLGDILNYAKSYLLVKHGTNRGVRDHFEIYHVVGDPTLQLWAAEPIPVGLRARVSRARLNIQLNSCPVGSVLTIWLAGKLLKRIAPSSPMVTIPTRDLMLLPSRLPPGQQKVTVCFSAPGCRFSQVSVRI